MVSDAHVQRSDESVENFQRRQEWLRELDRNEERRRELNIIFYNSNWFDPDDVSSSVDRNLAWQRMNVYHTGFNVMEHELLEKGWSVSEATVVAEEWERAYLNRDTYEYADNVRFARLDNADEVHEFALLELDGCCGCYHSRSEAVDVNGKPSLILFGFHYGH